MKYVTYYRVSTKKQKVHGWGLDAQREAVQRLIQYRPGEVIMEMEEVETGTGKRHRPVLQNALRYCKATGATLIIAKLDRLSRKVHFITGLMESKVKFVAADQPDIDVEQNPEFVQFLAVMAEKEARMIAERTREGLQVAREKGVKLGMAQPGRMDAMRAKFGEDCFRRFGKKAAAASVKVRKRACEDHYAHSVELIQQLRAEGKPWRVIVDALNEKNFVTRRGNPFNLATVYRLAQ